MPGRHSRDKGRRYENEVVGWLTAHGFPAARISEMYKPGPDIIALDDRYIEARRKASNYQSLAAIEKELEGDADLYFTRLDHRPGDHLVVLWATTLLDLIDERQP